MKIAGIVAEYNPFHNGHADHITLTRDPRTADATHIVAVMSGSFVQRGEPALFPKAERVRAALAGGVDLVIELPLPWVLTSAEGFAFGGVSLLHALGCVDLLSFGSECGDLAALEEAATVMEDPRYLSIVRGRMEYGGTAAEAYQFAMKEVGGTLAANLLSTPNNVLGMEYIKALRRLHSPIRPFTVKRQGAAHDDEYPVGQSASASYLRRMAKENRWNNAATFMPRDSFVLCSEAMTKGRAPADAARNERAMLLKLRRMSVERMTSLAGVSEGLENRLYNAASTADSLGSLLETLKTKRYTLTRLQRLLWAAMLDIPADWANRTPPYLRVLGMNERGREILNAAKHTVSVPLITRATQADALTGFAREVWETECRAADWYSFTLPTPLPRGTEYTDGIVRVD